MTMAPKGFFITGTDTDVGKTVVAAAVARYLRNQGLRVGVLKPVTSGAVQHEGRLVSEDAALLQWASGCTAAERDMAPYLLPEPLAPSEAAARAGVELCLEPIEQAFHRITANHDLTLVEGAGGLLVPLNNELLVADMASRLGLPLLIIARAALGTVNHTLMTCECAKARNLVIGGIIVNGQNQPPGPAEAYAPRLIAHHSGLPVVATLPYRATSHEHDLVVELSHYLATQPLARQLSKEGHHENRYE